MKWSIIRRLLLTFSTLTSTLTVVQSTDTCTSSSSSNMVSLSAASKAKATAYLQNLGFPVSAAETEKIMQGELVKVSIDSLTERELAAAFAVVIPKSPRDVERIFLDNLGKEDADDSIQQLVNSNDDGTTLDFFTL